MKVSWLLILAFAGCEVASGPCIAAAEDCKLITIAEWPVRLEHNKVIVDGMINGQKAGIVLDTGAERSFILRSAAVRLGLTLRRARGLRLFGIGGETEVEIANVDEFRIGDTTRQHWQVMVAGERDMGGDVAVLLGDDFFHRTDIEFDLSHHAVRLFQARDCDGVTLAYWSPNNAGQVDIEKVDDDHPHVILTVRINGQPVRALLDSGAGLTTLSTSDAARLGVEPETPGVVAVGRASGIGTKTANTWIGPFKTFAIDAETVENPRIFFSDLWKDAAYTQYGMRTQLGTQTMLLGADFLMAHRVMIAHSQRKLYFTYSGGPLFQLAHPFDAKHEPGAESGSRPSGVN
jgi:predicted aspartyl protease